MLYSGVVGAIMVCSRGVESILLYSSAVQLIMHIRRFMLYSRGVESRCIDFMLYSIGIESCSIAEEPNRVV